MNEFVLGAVGVKFADLLENRFTSIVPRTTSDYDVQGFARESCAPTIALRTDWNLSTSSGFDQLPRRASPYLGRNVNVLKITFKSPK